jgi:hypothetical protein
VELLESRAQRGLIIICSLGQGLSRDVILAFYLGRIEVNIVGATAGGVNNSTSDAFDEQLIVDRKVDDTVDCGVVLREHLLHMQNC